LLPILLLLEQDGKRAGKHWHEIAEIPKNLILPVDEAIYLLDADQQAGARGYHARYQQAEQPRTTPTGLGGGYVRPKFPDIRL
jgi:hypothetical protein